MRHYHLRGILSAILTATAGLGLSASTSPVTTDRDRKAVVVVPLEPPAHSNIAADWRRLGEQAKGMVMTELQTLGRRVIDVSSIPIAEQQVFLQGGSRGRLRPVANYVVTGQIASAAREEKSEGIQTLQRVEVAVKLTVVDVYTREVLTSAVAKGLDSSAQGFGKQWRDMAVAVVNSLNDAVNKACKELNEEMGETIDKAIVPTDPPRAGIDDVEPPSGKFIVIVAENAAASSSAISKADAIVNELFLKARFQLVDPEQSGKVREEDIFRALTQENVSPETLLVLKREYQADYVILGTAESRLSDFGQSVSLTWRGFATTTADRVTVGSVEGRGPAHDPDVALRTAAELMVTNVADSLKGRAVADARMSYTVLIRDLPGFDEADRIAKAFKGAKGVKTVRDEFTHPNLRLTVVVDPTVVQDFVDDVIKGNATLSRLSITRKSGSEIEATFGRVVAPPPVKLAVQQAVRQSQAQPTQAPVAPAKSSTRQAASKKNGRRGK